MRPVNHGPARLLSPFQIFALCAILILPAGCATYRVVEVGSGIDEKGMVSRFYGVARNNVLIPEYVVDVYGSYPTTEREARRIFDVTHYSVESYIKSKYALPNEFLYQLRRISWGSGFVLVSPIVLPIEWLGEAFGGPRRRGFGEVARDYFRSSFSERTYKKPKIRETVENF